METLWTALDPPGAPVRPLPSLVVTGAPGGLPSVYAVDAFATACVTLATAAIAELVAVRAPTPASPAGERVSEAVREVRVDRRHAAVAFRSERYQEPVGWTLPAIWDPIAGDYRTADGWIRIHTNYATHRAAALAALGEPEPTREAVARVVGTRTGEALEEAIVAAGGAAAMMRTAAAWAAHPQGRAVASEPLFATDVTPADAVAATGLAGVAPPRARGPGLAGLRVLDLTRVIAGPVCTRVLAAYGADVLRIDPPGFAEVPALLGETTGGKRRAALDLKSSAGRAAFDALVAGADVLVCGYRGPALEGLGLGVEHLRSLAPGLAIIRLDAYGWTGPWRARRGFDSLVQMSSGIAARTQAALGTELPGTLPAQALDHGAGYLLAAAAARALTRRHERGVATTVRMSLARIAHVLMSLGDTGDPRAPPLTTGDPYRERVTSSFGDLLRVRCPGSLAGLAPRWTHPPGPLGVDEPIWL